MKSLFRIFYILVFALFIVLAIYGNLKDKELVRASFTLEKYTEEPQKYGEYKAEYMGKITDISGDYFYFDAGGSVIKIFGSDVKNPVLGETVVYVNHRKDGKTMLIDYHNYNYNYLLYGISAFAFLLFVLVFFNEWKITRGGFKDA